MDKAVNTDEILEYDPIESAQTACDNFGWKYRGWENPPIGETINKFYWNDFRINKDAHAYLYGRGIDCCGE